MGITGLLPFVRNSCRPASIKDFSGATVAVDAYSWLHKGAFSCAEKLVKGEKTDGYVYYCIKQLNILLEAGLKPIMVFDGCNLCSKAITEKKRRENREKTRQRGKELLCEGKIKEARECFQRCVDITPEMAREVIEACRKKSVDCIVAPYEADAQLAYLDKIGMAQLIITEDSDLILFGCNKILFKMDSCGGGLLYEKENLPKSFGAKAFKFSFEKFRYMCILSGCDYLPSLPGIGLAKACKFFTLTNITDLLNVLPKVPSYLKMPKLEVTDEYKESFIKANNTFLYQLVFCPEKKCLVPLNPYPDDIKPADMEYAGKYLPNDLAYQLAMGNINVKTMEEFDTARTGNSSALNEDKSVVWGSQRSSWDSKAPNKAEFSAFKFNTPKPKITVSKKRQFDEIVEDSEKTTCTDEELFSMYAGLEAKKSPNESNAHKEEPIAEEPEEETLKNSPLPKVEPNQSPHPKLLNLPFRKIVRSRFFFTEHQNKEETSSSTTLKSEEKESKSDIFLPNTSEISPEKNSASVESSPETKDDCNFSLQLEIKSPKKENKENIIHRFAKKKAVDLTEDTTVAQNCHAASPKKLKNSSWLDVIDDESSASTSTISSTGQAAKLVAVNQNEFTTPDPPSSSSTSKKNKKRLITTRIHDFKWSKEFTKRRLNASLGSDGKSCNESLESSPETSKANTSNLSTSGDETSPYFQSPVRLNDNIMECATADEVINVPSDSEDESSSAVSSLNSSIDQVVSTTTTEPLNKVLEPLDNKSSKLGKCRTLGLSKSRKSWSKVSRKETLLNFNFIRQPKKEIPVIT